MHSLKAGFVVISDLSHLESMDPACALPMGTLMDLCSAGGVSSVVRVIPDPTKDIGFNIIARFHMPAPVRMETHEGLAEAINSVAEHFETAHA